MEPICCTPVGLPEEMQPAAAKLAVEINPANAPLVEVAYTLGHEITPEHLAFLTSRLWGKGPLRLAVQFLDNPPAALRAKILHHANRWGQWGNVKFVESMSAGVIRVNRGDGGYWSYLGTDCLRIPAGQPTMNLQAFTETTPESEFLRVVQHEFGHALGAVHEHARRAEVARLDVAKTIAYFGRTQGWSAAMVRQQVLTPIEEGSLLGTLQTDETSIMCYEIPGECTRDGQPVLGGADLSIADTQWIGKVYPLTAIPPSPPPPKFGAIAFAVDVAGKVVAVDVPAGWTVRGGT